MFTQNTEVTSSQGIVIGSKRASTRFSTVFGHHLPKWGRVARVLIFFCIVVTPYFAVTHVLEKTDTCPSVSAAPKSTTGPAKANPARPTSTLGYMSFPGATSQSLAASRCAFNSNLKRVHEAQSTALTSPEVAVTTATTTLLKKGSVTTFLLSIGFLLSYLYYFLNRNGSSDRKKARGDDIPMRARLVVGPVAWVLLALSMIYTGHALVALEAPTHGIAALSTAGPLSPSKLSSSTFRVAEANAFGHVMYGLNRPSELKAAAPNLDAVIKGRPVSKVEFQNYTNLYKKHVLSPSQSGSMLDTANAVKSVGTSLSAVSAITYQLVIVSRTILLIVFIVSCFLLVLLSALRAVRAWRWLKRWFVANLAAAGLLIVGMTIFLALNWGGVYAVSYITAPGKTGVVSGWGFAAYTFKVAGFVVPWIVFFAVYRYYRFASGRIMISMCKSDDAWVYNLGHRLTALRQRRIVLSKLILIIPRFRRRQLAVTS